MSIITAGSADSEILRELGARLRAYRIQQEFTVEELATRAGLSALTLLKAEQGGNPTLRTLLRLLRALGRIDLAESMLPAPPASPLAHIARIAGGDTPTPRRVRHKRRPSAG